MSESLPHQPADPASAADPTTAPGGLKPFPAPDGGPTNDQLTDRLRFYESFDELIQQNIARSSELLREAAARRDEAVAEIAMAKRTVVAERETQRGNLSELLDDVMAIQQAAERLAHRVSDALEQIEFEIEPDGLGLGGLGGGAVAAAGGGFGLPSGRHAPSTDAEAVHREVATGVLGQQPGHGASAASPTIGSGTASGSPVTAASDAATIADDAVSASPSDDPFTPEIDIPSAGEAAVVDAVPQEVTFLSDGDLSGPAPGSGPEAAPLESSTAGWGDQPPLVDLVDAVDGGVADVDDTADPVMSEDEVTSVGTATHSDRADTLSVDNAGDTFLVDRPGADAVPEASSDATEPTVAPTAETVDDLDLSASVDDEPSDDEPSDDEPPDDESSDAGAWGEAIRTSDMAPATGTDPMADSGPGGDADAAASAWVDATSGLTVEDDRPAIDFTDDSADDSMVDPTGDGPADATSATTIADVAAEPVAGWFGRGDASARDGTGTTVTSSSLDATGIAAEPDPVVHRPVMAAAETGGAADAPPVPSVEEQTTLVLGGVPRAATALAIQRHVLANDAVLRAEVREYYDHRLTLFVTANRPLRVSDLEGWDASATWEQVAATPDRLEMRLEM